MKTPKLNSGATAIVAQRTAEVKPKARHKTWYYVSENLVGFECDTCVFASHKQAYGSIVALVDCYARDADCYARLTHGKTAEDLRDFAPPYGYKPGVITIWEQWTIQKTRTDTPELDLYGKAETYFIRREHRKDGGVTVTLYASADGDRPDMISPVMVRQTYPDTQINPADRADNNAAFAALLRAYELAHAAGEDTTAPLYALATAAALSVVKKCIDPQRKTATDKQTVSNGGISGALRGIRRGIMADIALLDKLSAAMDAAYALQYNANGDLVQVVADRATDQIVTALQGETLSDGLDLVNTAVIAILEQTGAHATDVPGWMEQPYTIRHINRRVLARTDDTAAWADEQTTPIQEVYRAIRRAIAGSSAVQTDPRNGYLYIEDTAADPDSDKTETIYRRLRKWADLGGYTQSGHYDRHGNAERSSTYTADAQTVADYDAIMSALNLTNRQATIIRLRMSGYGYKAIATHLGVTPAAVKIQLHRIRDKCVQIGFDPGMWREITGRNIRID